MRGTLEADPSTFLDAGDLPAWLRELGEPTPHVQRPAAHRHDPVFPAQIEPLFLPEAPLPPSVALTGEASVSGPAPVADLDPGVPRPEPSGALVENVRQELGQEHTSTQSRGGGPALPVGVVVLLVMVVLVIAAALVVAGMGR
jgi:hypothetical protein